MSGTLRDQLLKAGLVSKSKVRQASHADEQHRRQKVAGGKSQKSAPPTAAQQAEARKVAHDLELNRRQQEKAQRRALRAQIEQLVEQARLPKLETEDYFNFVDDGSIRRVVVDAQRREGISQGRLAIVRYKGHYEVVPVEAAGRIREREERAVISLEPQAETASETAADDPYKQFVVPDDLTW